MRPGASNRSNRKSDQSNRSIITHANNNGCVRGEKSDIYNGLRLVAVAADGREEEHCHLFSNSYYCCFALASETSTTDDYDDDDDDGPNDAEPIFMINQRLFSPSVSRLRMPAC